MSCCMCAHIIYMPVLAAVFNKFNITLLLQPWQERHNIVIIGSHVIGKYIAWMTIVDVMTVR
jgi:hypothetical protein